MGLTKGLTKQSCPKKPWRPGQPCPRPADRSRPLSSPGRVQSGSPPSDTSGPDEKKAILETYDGVSEKQRHQAQKDEDARPTLLARLLTSRRLPPVVTLSSRGEARAEISQPMGAAQGSSPRAPTPPSRAEVPEGRGSGSPRTIHESSSSSERRFFSHGVFVLH